MKKRYAIIYRIIVLAMGLFFSAFLLYEGWAQTARNEPNKPAISSTVATKGQTGETGSEARIIKVEDKMEGLEKTIDVLQHSVDQAGSYGTNVSNIATYVITATGVFVIVVTIIAGVGTQYISERHLKAIQSEHEARMKSLQASLQENIEQAKIRIEADLGKVDSQLAIKMSTLEEKEKAIEAFRQRIQQDIEKLETVSTQLEQKNQRIEERLKDYQPARDIKAEIVSMYEPPDVIQLKTLQEILLTLLRNEGFPQCFKDILITRMQELTGLIPKRTSEE
jgi:peptidoglycan hydrolase CwlO-like protein